MPTSDSKKILDRLDIYRDGGSVSISFVCDGIQSALFFEIDMRDEIQFSNGTMCKQYKSPVLRECHHFQWTNKVGAIMDDFLHSKLPVSWETARAILHELTPQMIGFVSEYLHLFDEIVRIVETEGTGLPTLQIPR